MASSHPTFSERLTSGALGALFGAAIGLLVAWLLMFSATLHLLGFGSYPVSFTKSAAAGAVFFGVAGVVFGSLAGTLVGRVLAGIYEFERFFDRRSSWVAELVLALAGLAVILWANGVFTA